MMKKKVISAIMLGLTSNCFAMQLIGGKILSDKIIQESGRVDIKYSYLLDLYNEPRRILSLLGFEAGETPCGINSHLTALKSSDSNDGMMREHYFRLQSIFGGKQLLDPED